MSPTELQARAAGRGTRFMFGLTALVAAIGAGQASGAKAPASPPSDWAYSGSQGPEHWGDLDASFATCRTGRLQSPIDIDRVHRVPYVPLTFQYHSQPLEAYNSGKGIHVVSPPGSALLVRGDVYDLDEFVFHVPGEHRFKGARPEAEIQLVHRNRLGAMVVVAVPLRSSGRENRILTRVLDHLPSQPGERVHYRQVGINPLFLLPSRRGYFRYTGSASTPPCKEPVLWYVLYEPLDVTKDQLRRLAELVGSNARPVQPLNDREVFWLAR